MLEHVNGSELRSTFPAADQRLVARSSIITDRLIPPMARLLYLFLDDKANGEDHVAIDQAEAGRMLGVCRRQVNKLASLLQNAGYIMARRSRRGSAEYRFVWRKPAALAASLSRESPAVPLPDNAIYADIISQISGETPSPRLLDRIRDVETRLDVPEQVICRWLDDKCRELRGRAGGRPFVGILGKAVVEDLPGWLRVNADRVREDFRRRDLRRQMQLGFARSS
ncbi:MAG TPA: hypothetical protein VK789_28145 [Bryobacteraceae bacterium]|jgi:hypothetical protein|nr:hypothetical protein [Bryobacteraceae bacterium]